MLAAQTPAELKPTRGRQRSPLHAPAAAPHSSGCAVFSWQHGSSGTAGSIPTRTAWSSQPCTLGKNTLCSVGFSMYSSLCAASRGLALLCWDGNDHIRRRTRWTRTRTTFCLEESSVGGVMNATNNVRSVYAHPLWSWRVSESWSFRRNESLLRSFSDLARTTMEKKPKSFCRKTLPFWMKRVQ